MTRKFDVVGVGYTALDYLGIVPHLPEEDHKLEMSGFAVQGGGPTATALVTVRRLGLDSSFLGKVGDDDFGKKMIDELRREGVDLSGVVVERGGRSQFAFILVDERTAARTILWTRGSLSAFEAEEVDTGIVERARGLLIDSLEPGAALAAARAAKTASIPVVIDAGTLRDGVEELLPLCDYIVASETFSKQISGRGHFEALDRLLSYGAEAVVITLGESGCLARTRKGLIESPGFKVDAVDTTGAGDNFNAGFISSYINGRPLRECAIIGSATAALKIGGVGWSTYPTRKQVNTFLADMGFIGL